MILTVHSLREFIKQAQKLTITEVGISQTLHTISYVPEGDFDHHAFVELSGFGAYEVHYVALAAAPEASASQSPSEELVKASKAAAAALAERLKKELPTISIIDGVFGTSRIEVALNSITSTEIVATLNLSKENAETAEKTT